MASIRFFLRPYQRYQLNLLSFLSMFFLLLQAFMENYEHRFGLSLGWETTIKDTASLIGRDLANWRLGP